ncbi:cysteine hydrolase family protein [Micromonospora yangpuensis]|uniref:Nicotinamidase-related amidase n=1 Tax=Micromonospora yangpuensis TaxID=683228 RepID=A0A1C6UPL9_9ACTN|nr:isochorismatase family cysteine hydrolase [Micromonospora yangpuensis]GGM08552.1 isochorismatase [Micromonospora yangpuensis]SCL55863.1 Nicotinamidase-related amidase [Micromonospora yangpuensis]
MRTLGTGDTLIVIDVQRKYVNCQGPLAVPDGPALVQRIARFAEAARTRRVPVVWVTREQRPGVSMGTATEAAYGVAMPDLFQGPAAELDPDLGARDDEVRVVKPRQSAFYGTDLEVVLRTAGTRRVILAGVTTNICVQATAQDARARDLEVVVPADLTAALAVTKEGFELSAAAVQQATLATLAHAVGTVCPSAELLGQP